jgi:hypothetical protein
MSRVTRARGNPTIVTFQSSFLRKTKSETFFEGNQQVKPRGALGRDIGLYGVCGGCLASDFISAESEFHHDAERRFSPQRIPWIQDIN